MSRTAIEQGLLSELAASAQSREQIAQLIFQPAFSTRRTAGDLSGRGMGLSVVYEAARKLQGEAYVRLGEGSGTTIVVSVPLSISTTHLIAVSCGGETFAIPAHAVEGVVQLKSQEVETGQGKPLVRFGAKLIPLYLLSELLGVARPDTSKRTDVFKVLIVGGDRPMGIAVDAFEGDMHANVQGLGLGKLPSYIAGGVVQSDGSVVVVLSPGGLAESCLQAGIGKLKSLLDAPDEVAPRILVVDDSITTRMMEKAMLEAHGYRVSVGVDGVQALDLLRREHFDVVLSDLEMPHLDGYGLIQAMKADKTLSPIPVIVVSSQQDAEQRALDLGAAGCVVKGGFDSLRLLQLVRQVL